MAVIFDYLPSCLWGVIGLPTLVIGSVMLVGVWRKLSTPLQRRAFLMGLVIFMMCSVMFASFLAQSASWFVIALAALGLADGVILMCAATWRAPARSASCAAYIVFSLGLGFCLIAYGSFLYWQQYLAGYCVQFPAGCG